MAIQNYGDREPRNHVEEFLLDLLGGVRSAARTLDVSTQTLYTVLGRGYLCDRETAIRWQEIAAGMSREIPAAGLMGLLPFRNGTGGIEAGVPDGNVAASPSGRGALDEVAAPGAQVSARSPRQTRALNTPARGRASARSTPSYSRVASTPAAIAA